jgi:hypothetical protein
MGKINEPLPVKLIFSVFTSTEDYFLKAKEEITCFFNNIEQISDKFTFNHTRYYEKEFGKDLFRKFIIVKELYKRDNIAKVKIISNKIEELLSINGKRMVNIDPGYMSLENFVLFTTKNYTHRIYLESGIFADLTLIYQNNDFMKLPWTYPDYSSDEIRNYLKTIRESYKEQLKNKEEILNAKTCKDLSDFN